MPNPARLLKAGAPGSKMVLVPCKAIELTPVRLVNLTLLVVQHNLPVIPELGYQGFARHRL